MTPQERLVNIMYRAKITSKGQVTLPAEFRSRLGLKPGDRIIIRETASGYVLEKDVTESPFSRFVGCLSDKEGEDPDKLIEEMRDK